MHLVGPDIAARQRVPSTFTSISREARQPLQTFLGILHHEYSIAPAAIAVLFLSLAVLLMLVARPSWRKHEPLFGLMLFGGAIAHILYFSCFRKCGTDTCGRA